MKIHNNSKIKVNVSGSQQYTEKVSLARNQYNPSLFLLMFFPKPKYTKTNIVVFLSVSLISLFVNIDIFFTFKQVICNERPRVLELIKIQSGQLPTLTKTPQTGTSYVDLHDL